MKIYVGGINAVGKSTLLKEAAERLGYRYIHATTGLLDSLGFGKDYEKLRALTQRERDIKLGEYIRDLLHDRGSRFLLDGHYLGLVRGEVNRLTDSWLKDFDMLVLVSAPLGDIWRRIESDSKTRDRALFPADISEEEKKEMLLRYQKQTAEEFGRLAKLYEKPHVEILNEENRLKESVQRLVSFIETREDALV